MTFFSPACRITYMSTKTIAVDLAVYRKLLGLKRESESFSRLLDRLAEEVGSAGTGAEVLRRLGHASPALSGREAAVMREIVKAHRNDEAWGTHDLS